MDETDDPESPESDWPKGLIEKVAIRIAVANNGGTWAEHYTDHQKAVWRFRAAQIINEVAKALRDG